MKLTCAQRTRPCSGFTASGDLVVVRQEGDATMLAVVDVLGHGPSAAEVAQQASACLRRVDLEADVEAWTYQLHEALSRTRGAAVGLGRSRGSDLQLAVVGNVAIASCGTRVGIVASPGIVGRRLRKLRTFSFSMKTGDRLALYSDGLRHVDMTSTCDLSLERACESIMATHATAADDASLLLTDFHDA
ncbi:MAG: SpoIIE family protein phosphatase [Nannocystaceae bacterium]|nr:serine/threonine-protein phosphatase [bacterium]